MTLTVKYLQQQDYQITWQAMQDYTDQRDDDSDDQIWIVEHPAVFTQGLNGKAEHLLQKHNIPIVQTDRGGQITYHGPGQLVLYTLLDLKRQQLGVRALVSLLENCLIEYLAQYDIQAEARADAPGVYVENKKIASLGLKIRKHKSYHGLALNIDMDLTPFGYVNPCGLAGMQMTQLADLIKEQTLPTIEQAGQHLSQIIQQQLKTQQATELKLSTQLSNP